MRVEESTQEIDAQARSLVGKWRAHPLDTTVLWFMPDKGVPNHSGTGNDWRRHGPNEHRDEWPTPKANTPLTQRAGIDFRTQGNLHAASP